VTTSSPIDMRAFENAVHTWFVAATGLQAIWRKQSAPQPKRPYGSLLRIAGPVQAAPQWEERNNYDAARALGKEIEVVVCVPCSITISCQVYVGQPDASNPDVDAMDYILRADASLSQPNPLELLRASAVSVIGAETPQDLSQLVENEFDSRANLDVRFGASLNSADYIGYINKVGISSPAIPNGIGVDFDVTGI